MGSKKPNRQKVLVALLSAILALGGDPLATRAWAEELAPEPAPVVAEAESLADAGEVLVEEQAAETEAPAPQAPADQAQPAVETDAPADSQEPEGNPEQSQAPPVSEATASNEAPAQSLTQEIKAAEAPVITTYTAPEDTGSVLDDANASISTFSAASPLRAASADTMVVYYGFREVKPSTSRPSSITVGKNLLFAPTSVTSVATNEAFLGLPNGCGMMQVSSLTKSSSNKSPGGTFIAAVKHPSDAQKSINTKVGFDGCNGSFYYFNDTTYWHYACDGGGVPNASFRIYTYNEATVNKSALTAQTTTKKEVSSTDIKIPKNELKVTLNVNGTLFNIDSSRWTFVDDTVNYVKNDRQITIQFGNVQASCNVEFYGAEPDPHAYKSVSRDADKTGNLKVGETLHYDVKVTNEAATGSIWKNVTITDKIPLGLKLVEGSVNLARTKTIDPADQIASIPLASAKYNYDKATRTITLEIPYYVLNSQAYDLTYDLTVDATSIAGGEAGGANETRNLTNTVNVNGYDSDGKAYPCDPTACLPIPGETDPNNVKVEQVVPGSENDPDPEHTETDPIAYLEHTKDAQNMTDTRPGAVTQVYDVIKYTMTMENTAAGSVFRDAAFVDQMPEGLEIILGDAEHPMSINKATAIEDEDYWTDNWSVPVSDDSYDPATRTLTATCGDMFYGEKVTLTFYAQVTPEALGKDIGNTGTIAAAAPQVDPETGEPQIDPETGNPVTEPKEDNKPEPTYPEPEKDKPVETEVEKPVIDPETGEPKVDPETGEPVTETVTETTGGVAAGDPEPKVEKTIEVVSKKEGVEVTDANRNVPQVGDVVRTTVVITNTKEGTEWVNVTVDDSCNSALELIPDSIRVFDPQGNDVTEQCLKLDPETQKIKLDIPNVTGGDVYTLQYDAVVTGDAIDDSNPDQPNITDPVKVEGETPDPTAETKPSAEHKPTNMARPGDPLDNITKTMKVLNGAVPNAVSEGDTVQFTIIAGNLGDATTSALRPMVLDPLPEGMELSSDYVYVTKMGFNRRTQEWEKASPAYVRKIARAKVYNQAARTLVIPVGEALNGSDRVCKGQTGYQIVFECTVTATDLASEENMGNIAYSESEKPSEQPEPAKPADPSDEPADPSTYPVDDEGDIVKPKVDPETGEPVVDPETGEPETEKITDPEGKPIKPGDTKEDHPSIPDDKTLEEYIEDQLDPKPIVKPEPQRPTYPVDEDGDIVNPDGEKVKDPEGKPIKPGDTKEDHPSIPEDQDIDDYIQNPIDPETGEPVVPDPDDPTKPSGAEPVRDPNRPVYPVDKDGDIVDPTKPVIDPDTNQPKVDPETGEPVYEKILDPEGNPIKNTDTEKDHPNLPEGKTIDEYIQEQGGEPLPKPYPTDDDGDVVQPVVDPETGDPVVDPETGEPVYEKVVDANGDPIKPDDPDAQEKLEDLDIPQLTALHQVIKEVAKLAKDDDVVVGKAVYDSGKTGADRVSTQDDTSFTSGDRINTTVKVKNLVKGTRWSGAIVIDKPANLIVTYYELVDPYGRTLSQSDPLMKGLYGKASKLRRAPGDGTETTPAPSSSVARLRYDEKNNQFRLTASEIVGLEQYQVYYEGYVPEGTTGDLEDMVKEQPKSNNPLEDQNKSNGPSVPDGTPTNPTLPKKEDPEPQDPDPQDPEPEEPKPQDPEPQEPQEPGDNTPAEPQRTLTASNGATVQASASQQATAIAPKSNGGMPATGDPATFAAAGTLLAAALGSLGATGLAFWRKRRDD